jgi:short-subunit dehydrogenase
MLDFSGQIAVVTGASRGIGYFIAKELAIAGAHVIAVARSGNDLQKLQGESNGKVKERFTLWTADLADMDTIDGLGKFVEKAWGKTDVLIANAGEFGQAGPIADLDPTEFEHTILLNFISTWRTYQGIRRTTPKIGRCTGSCCHVWSGSYRASLLGRISSFQGRM